MTVTHKWRFVLSTVVMLIFLAQILRYWHLHGHNWLVALGLVLFAFGIVSAFRKLHVTWQIDESDGSIQILRDSKLLFKGTSDDLREVREDACDVFLFTQDKVHIQIPKDAMNDVLRKLVLEKNVAEQVAASDR